MTELRQVQVELADLQAQRVELADQERVLEDLRGVIRQAGPFITRALVQQVGEEAARIFGEIMQDHTRLLAWDEEYRISLVVDGNERQFSQLSGGEQIERGDRRAPGPAAPHEQHRPGLLRRTDHQPRR